MYAIIPAPERETRVYLHCRGSVSREFNSIEDLCLELPLDFVEGNVGRNYDSPIKIVTKRGSGLEYDKVNRKFWYRTPDEYYWHYADFIIRTEDGRKLTAQELQPVYWRLRRQRPWRPWQNRHGRKTEYCFGTFRHPKTTNERRQAFQCKDEKEPPIRARRNCNNMINAWDDRSSHCEKGWKFQSKRKKQYRSV